MKHIFKKNNKIFTTAATMQCVATLVIAVLLTGCKKYLDMPPKDKVPQPVLLRDEQGFKDALIGVYMAMDKATNGGSGGLYTERLSMGMLSTLAYDYDNASTTSFSEGLYANTVYYFYDQPGVKTAIDGIWAGMYNNIANINNILSQIEGRKDIFSGTNFNRVKGEAIALRALFHFDLARMFGQSPFIGASAKGIPYRTQVSVGKSPFLSLQGVLDSCILDLTTAQDLLATTDTSAIQKGNYDPFIAYTQNHLNYWAVQGLLARVNLYKGDLVNAEKYAGALIGSNKFPLVSSNVAGSGNIVRDRLFSQEHLFSVYSTNVKTYNANCFDRTSGTPLRLLPAGKTNIYATGSGSVNDWRYTSWFDNSQGGLNVPSKYFQDNNLPYELQGIVPVIRMSEMYYIAAECATSRGDIAGGTSFINKVRQARGLTALNATGITTTDSLSKEIMKEYQKEFIGEGQTFFYFKRLNKDLKQVTATTATVIPNNVYVFPVPDLEKEYN